MKKTIMQLLVFIFALSFLFTGGCALFGQKYSGFLQDYPEMLSGGEGALDQYYIKEGVDIPYYKKIMLDHVVFYFNEDNEYKGIHADELKELADAFHSAMEDSLADAYPLVLNPGPGVVRIRTAITNLAPDKPDQGEVKSVLPSDTHISKIHKRLCSSVTVGKAAMEMEFLDSMTNERLAVVVDMQGGDKGEATQSLDKWEEAKKAFAFWGKRIRLFLDKANENQN